MEKKVQQRVCTDFCFRLRKTGAETYEMLQAAFGESCLSQSKTFEWYSHFKSGRRSFEDDPHPGRPSTSHTKETVARVREIIHADRCLIIREVAEEVRIAFGMCQKILTEDLQMRRVTAKFVPRLLMAEQNDRVSTCTDLRDRAQNDPNFMSSVITGDECWVYRYDPETKQMSSQWSTSSSPRPKKARHVKSNIKTMLIAFFDIDRLVHHEFIPTGQTVNKEFHKTVCNASVTMYADIALRSGAPPTGSCTMTTSLPTGLSPQMNFWQNTTFHRSHNLPTHLTLLHVTSSCSHN